MFDRVRAFSAEVEQRLAACRALPPETIYEQLYAMEGDDLAPLPMETGRAPEVHPSQGA